jgi:BolA protein
MSIERIQKIRFLLETALQPSFLEIQDDSHKHIGHAGAQSGGGHFAICIASPHFDDQKIIECHRMIYAALAAMMQKEIHALKIKLL